jgi:G3E family GTPase
MWSWVLHRITGVAIFFFLLVHILDTALVRAHALPVEEIAGGCFCCRFNSLVEAADRLSLDTAPDILLAEPVGSCTDLVATVSLPLARIYGDRFTVAPVSVVVDPLRALRILGVPGASGGSFCSSTQGTWPSASQAAASAVRSATIAWPLPS